MLYVQYWRLYTSTCPPAQCFYSQWIRPRLLPGCFPVASISSHPVKLNWKQLIVVAKCKRRGVYWPLTYLLSPTRSLWTVLSAVFWDEFTNVQCFTGWRYTLFIYLCIHCFGGSWRGNTAACTTRALIPQAAAMWRRSRGQSAESRAEKGKTAEVSVKYWHSY